MSEVEKAFEVFSEIESNLIGIARNQRVEEPEKYVKSWFIRLHRIVKNFEEGKTEKKVFLPTGEWYVLPEDATAAQIKEFKESQKRYLVKSFTRHIIKNKKKNHKEISTSECSDATLWGNIPDSMPEAYSLFPETKLSDLISLIDGDIKKMQRLARSPRDKVQVLFLQALSSTLSGIQDQVGDINPIADDKGKTLNKILAPEIREGLNAEVKKRIVLYFEEQDPLVQIKLVDMIKSKDNNIINQRISRYFKLHGGIIQRLNRKTNDKRV